MTRPFAPALGLALAVAAPALALDPIDDFEVGTFSVSASDVSQEHTFPVPSHEAHAIWRERTIVLSPDGGPVSAETVGGITFVDRSALFEATAGTCGIDYRWGFQRDITDGGALDRIELEVLSSGPGEVSIAINSPGGAQSLLKPTSGGVEVLTWDLDEWTLVDPTQATSLGISFGPAPGPAAASYQVFDVRFHRRGAQAVDYVEQFVATQFPPLPSPPLRFEVWDLFGQPLYETDVTFVNADAGFVPEMHVEWQEVLPARGAYAVMDVHWDDPSPYVNTSFEIRIDIAPADGWLPELYPPDPIVPPEGDGILLAFPIRMGDGQSIFGTSEIVLAIDPALGQGLSFENVSVVANPVAREWGTSFLLAFDAIQVGEVEGAFPVLRASWISDWAEAVTVGVPGAGPSPGREPALRARPTVMRAGSTFHLNAAPETGARVRIHDVAGRMIRTLAVPAGVHEVFWNGRDARGVEVPPGVYFVRLDGAPRDPARVVRIR